MKVSALIDKEKVLSVLLIFASFSILLVSCGSGASETAGKNSETNSTEQETTQSGQANIMPSIPIPEPSPVPPSPASPGAQEVNCGIGAFNIINCSSQTGEKFDCSGDSHAVGSHYSCTDPEGNQFDCSVVAARMGGFTLSCTKPL
jgi:hypothetical protein